MATCNKGWIDKWEQVVMALLCVLMADCAIFGAGRSITFGPLGFRTVLTALTVAAAVPLMVRDFKKLIRCKILWMVAAFATWLVVQTIRGVRNGNDPVILASDLKGFWYFVMLVPAICVLNTKERIHTLMKVLLYSSAFLALASLVATCLFRWNYELFLELYHLDPAEHVLDLSVVIKRKVPRLFFRSSNYWLMGCAASVYYYITEQKKCRWHYPVITGICLFAVLMTYTRAVYLATFVTAAILALVVMCWGNRKMKIAFWKHVAAAMLVFAVITVGLSALAGTNYMKHGITRVVSTFNTPEKAATAPAAQAKPAEKPQAAPTVVKLSNTEAFTEPKTEKNQAAAMTKGSDKTRAKTLKEMNTYIRQAPLLGHGLGKAITVRHNGLTEYFYRDLLVKTGAIGLILYLLPALWLVLALIRKSMSTPNKLILGCWVAVLLGFMGFSYYNPYMNASLGILFYCCTVGVFGNLKYKRKF